MTIDRHPQALRELIRENLKDSGWEVFEVSYDSIEDLESVPLEEIDAVLLAPARYFPPLYMDRLTKCKLLQIWSAGYDKFNVADARLRGLAVANNHGANAVSVAEHTIFMMLGVSRRAPEMHNRVVAGNWGGNDHGMSSYSLNGKTLGVVGLGNIGTLVAKRAEAMGMQIAFADPAFEQTPNPAWQKLEFDELIGRSDYLTFHVHLDSTTRNMLHSENLGLLLKTPFLINVSRAELINREALVSALETKVIRGVAIDAHYDEPTDSSDEIFAFENVFFSPHVAGSTVDSYKETISACIRNILAAVEGGFPQGIVGVEFDG